MSGNKVLQKYLASMLEIRRRLEVIQCFRDEKCHGKYKIINYEVIFFQLRKILEIIVKAPLLINEVEYRKLYSNAESDWRIQDILKKLSKINPDHYPKPVKEVFDSETNLVSYVNLYDEFLSQKELITAYQFCSSFLHSENPLAEEQSFNTEKLWATVIEVTAKINRLLNQHIFIPTSGDIMYLITMENGQGVPAGYVWDKIGDLNSKTDIDIKKVDN